MPKEVIAVIPKIEQVLDKFKAKPHCGKLFVMSADKMYDLYGQDAVRFEQFMNKVDK